MSKFTTSRPDHHFLARWWVNDDPFAPKQLKDFVSFAGYGLVHEAKELRLKPPFRTERLGAKLLTNLFREATRRIRKTSEQLREVEN